MPTGIYKHTPTTEETKMKISLAMRGKKNGLGCKCSDEKRQKIKEKKLEYYKTHPSPFKGKHQTEDAKRKIGQSKRWFVAKKPPWDFKETGYGYTTIHYYIKRRKPKPLQCELCKKIKLLELAFKDHNAGCNNIIYTRNVDDYFWICRSCHMKGDGRIRNTKNGK